MHCNSRQAAAQISWLTGRARVHAPSSVAGPIPRIPRLIRMARRLALLTVLSTAVACASAPAPARHVGESPKRPDPVASARAAEVELHLPFSGSWAVSQGYHGEPTHHGRAAYALDLVKLREDGQAYERTGRRTKDWYGFGADVLASADGVVVRAIDRFPDNRILGTATETNTVILKHGDVFTEYVHLKHGSLRVQVGEHVRRGQALAQCGNSGSQTPHLHWALLSSLTPIQTRPASFVGFEARSASGAWQPSAGVPAEGEVVRAR